MHTLNSFRVGLITGFCVALWHILWSIFVALGWAQAILNFALWVHALNNPFFVEGFDLTRTSLLIGFTFIVGFAFGWIFATVWNYVHARAHNE